MIAALFGLSVVALGLFSFGQMIWLGRIETRLGILERRFREASLELQSFIAKGYLDE